MSCCGKVKNILKGSVRSIYDEWLHIEPEKTIKKRITICTNCDKSTWLTSKEFYTWLKKYGIINFAKQFNKLEKIPPLPIKEKIGVGKRLWCSICKCGIHGKARVENEKCLLGKW